MIVIVVISARAMYYSVCFILRGGLVQVFPGLTIQFVFMLGSVLDSVLVHHWGLEK